MRHVSKALGKSVRSTRQKRTRKVTNANPWLAAACKMEPLEPRVLLSGTPATGWTSVGFGGGGGFFDPTVSPTSTTGSVGIFVASDMGDLFRTTNSGQNWDMINYQQMVTSSATHVQFTSNSTTLYAQGKKSTDGGTTWTNLVTKDTLGNPFTVNQTIADVNSTGNVYVTSNNTIYFTHDGLDANPVWTQLPGYSVDPHSLQYDPNNGQYDINGAYISGVYSYGSGSSEVIDLAVNNGDSNSSNGSNLLYQSVNAGQTFSLVNTTGFAQYNDARSFSAGMASGDSGPTLYTLPMGPSNEAGSGDGLEFPYSATTNIYKLVGTQWQAIPVSGSFTYTTINAMVVDPHNPSIIYLAAANGNQPMVIKSTDGGATWASVYDPGWDNSNVQTGVQGINNDFSYGEGGVFKEIAIDPNNSNIVVANNEDSVYLSVDGGLNWKSVVSPGNLNAEGTSAFGVTHPSSQINDTSVFATDFLSPTSIMGGQSDVLSDLTTDAGSTWAAPVIEKAGETQRSIDNLGSINTMYNASYDAATGVTYGAMSTSHDAYDPSDANDSGTKYDNSFGAVGVSSDGGHSWTLLTPSNQGGFGGPVMSVLVDPADATGHTLYALVRGGSTTSTTQTYGPSNGSAATNHGGVWVTHDIQDGPNATWYELANATAANDHPYSMQFLSNGTLLVTYGANGAVAANNTVSPNGSGLFVLPGTYNTATNNFSNVTPSSWFNATPTFEGSGGNLTGLAAGTQSTAQVESWDVIVDPSDATQQTWYLASTDINVSYSGVAAGLWKTTDAGHTWSLYFNNPTFGGPTSAAINPATGEMYIGVYSKLDSGGLYYTSSYASSNPSFSKVADYPFSSVLSVTFDPYDASQVWTGTFGGGMIRGTEATGTAPSNFNVNADNSTGNQSITLTWNAADPNATYEVDYVAIPQMSGQNIFAGSTGVIGDPTSSAAVKWNLATTLNASTTSYTFNNLTPGTQYAFRVVAIDGGVRTSSVALPGMILPRPTALTAVGVAGVQSILTEQLPQISQGTPQLLVTWSGVNTSNNFAGITGYKVEYSTDNHNWTLATSDVFANDPVFASGKVVEQDPFPDYTSVFIIAANVVPLNASGTYSVVINTGLQAGTGYYVRVTPISPSTLNSSTGEYTSVAYAATTTSTQQSALSRSAWSATSNNDSNEYSGNSANQALDNNMSTSWGEGGMASGNWYQVDMQSAQTIDEIVMDAGIGRWGYPGNFAGSVNYFVITTSLNGTDWSSPIYTGTNPGGVAIDATFTPVNARYIRITSTGGSTTGDWWQINEFNAYNSGTAPVLQTGPTPYSGTPVTITATGTSTVEAENYDQGGEGVGYHDADPADQGTSSYRPADGVDIYDDAGASNGRAIGWTSNGEWLGYTLNIAQAGNYDITLSYSSGMTTSGQAHLEFGPVGQIGGSGTTSTSEFTLPPTAGWLSYSTVTLHNVTLAAGTQWMRLVEDNTTYNLDAISFAPSVVSTLPAGWTHADIGVAGDPAITGNASYNAGTDTWTVAGSGSNVWGTSDHFHYASEVVTGDQVLTAEVTSITNTADSAKAGVMFRDSSADSSAMAILDVKPGGGMEFMYRAQLGGSVVYVNGAGVNPPSPSTPVWLRLVKTGTTYSAYYSTDGSTFNLIGSQTVTFTNNNYMAGVAVSSLNNAMLNTSTFSQVSVAPPIPSIVTAENFGTLRSDATAWVGFQFTTGSSSVTAAALGRWVVAGNTANHPMEIVDATTHAIVASTVVSTLGATGGAFGYANLSSPVTLAANHAYYVLSYETAGGDQWYNDNTTISTISGITVNHDIASPDNTTFNTYVTGNYSFGPVTIVTAPIALPTGFTDADVGGPGIPGSATYNSGVWTVSGSGGDIFGASDQFNFASQTLNGDGSVVAKVTSLTATNQWAKAGVMIRDSAASNAYEASVVVSPMFVYFQWRNQGNLYSAEAADGGTAPMWVQLTRVGNTFTASYSTDGSAWNQVGSPQTITMGASTLAGLAVTAVSNSQLNTATFTDVAVTSTPSGDVMLSRTGWVATASATEGGGSPANALDGDSTTRWSNGTAQVGGEWFQIDLGAPASFDRIVLDSGSSTGDYARDYAVYVSNNGTDWSTQTAVATGAGSSSPESISFSLQTARYIRIVQTGNGAGSWWSIVEANLYV